jgi:hypothetical protein
MFKVTCKYKWIFGVFWKKIFLETAENLVDVLEEFFTILEQKWTDLVFRCSRLNKFNLSN